MHGIEHMTHMDIFYHAMNYTLKGTMDVSFRGAFRRKRAKEVAPLIEELAKSNYRAPSKASGNSIKLRGGGVIELNKMSTIEAKLDAIMDRMSHHERRNHSAHEVGMVESAKQKSVAEQGLTHEGPYQVEEAQFIDGNMSYNFKPNNNLPTHYTLALRNHEKLSFGGGMKQGPRTAQNFQNYAPPGFQQRADNQG